MSKILLSIKPEYAFGIIAGQKKYEFRRRIASKNVETILIYCTSPYMQVIGEAKVQTVLSMPPEALWEATKEKAGISKELFEQYFEDVELANAYELGKITKYRRPRPLESFGVKMAPQSFIYITE